VSIEGKVAQYSFSWYISLMSITQTIDIPVSRRLTIEVPREIPIGKVVLTFTPVLEQKTDVFPLFEDEESDLFGIWKDKSETADVAEYVRTLRKGRIF
jgi:hypothetical protein